MASPVSALDGLYTDEKQPGLAAKLEVPNLFPTINLVDQEIWNSISSKSSTVTDSSDNFQTPNECTCAGVWADLIGDIKEVIAVTNKFTLKYFFRVFCSHDPPIYKIWNFLLLFLLFCAYIIWPIFMVLTGSICLTGRCDLNRNVPIWSLVYGTTLLANAFFNFIFLGLFVKDNSNEGHERPVSRLVKFQRLIDLILIVWLLAWKIAGSVWVIQLRIDLNQTEFQGCRNTCFQTALSQLFILWVFFIYQILAVVSFIFYKVMVRKMETKYQYSGFRNK